MAEEGIVSSVRSRNSELPIRRTAAHAERLGLTKRERLTKKTPPDFLLSTSLSLDTTRMRKARERHIPIVLIADLNQVTAADGCVEAWLAADESA